MHAVTLWAHIFIFQHDDEEIVSLFLYSSLQSPHTQSVLGCKDGRNFLLHAVSGGNVQATEYLLKCGAPINSKSEVHNDAIFFFPNKYIESGSVKSYITNLN